MPGGRGRLRAVRRCRIECVAETRSLAAVVLWPSCQDGLVTNDHVQRSGLVEWTAMTVDCPEPMVMADFYAALLGGTVTLRDAGDAKLDAAGRLIYFRAAPDYRPPTWPSPEVPLHSHF